MLIDMKQNLRGAAEINRENIQSLKIKAAELTALIEEMAGTHMMSREIQLNINQFAKDAIFGAMVTAAQLLELVDTMKAVPPS